MSRHRIVRALNYEDGNTHLFMHLLYNLLHIYSNLLESIIAHSNFVWLKFSLTVSNISVALCSIVLNEYNLGILVSVFLLSDMYVVI